MRIKGRIKNKQIILEKLQRGEYILFKWFVIIKGYRLLIVKYTEIMKLLKEPQIVKSMLETEVDFVIFYDAFQKESRNIRNFLKQYKKSHIFKGAELDRVYVKLYYENKDERPQFNSDKYGMKWIAFDGDSYSGKDAISFGIFDYTFRYYVSNLGNDIMYIYPYKKCNYFVKRDASGNIVEIIGNKFRFDKKGKMNNLDTIKEVVSMMTDEGLKDFREKGTGENRNSAFHTIICMKEEMKISGDDYSAVINYLQDLSIE